MKKSVKRTMPLWVKWCFCILPLLIAVILYFLLPHIPVFTEYAITQGIFRVISLPLNAIISIFPFSVTEIVVLLALPSILTLLGIFIYRLIKCDDHHKIVEKAARFVCWCLSIAALMYMLMHGAHYHRLSVGELMQLQDNSYDASFLTDVTIDLAKKASAAREQVAEDENGCMILSQSITDTLKEADDGYAVLRSKYPFLLSGTWRAKPVMLSHYWSYTGITGIYCPWLGESNVNVDVPHSGIPQTAAHEVAHTMGFAREDACNFLSFLGCINSENVDYQYAGYLTAYIYCSNALYQYDQTTWRQAFSHCSAGVVRDLKQRNAYWDQFKGEIMDTAEELNDAFIKGNGVESGVLNYNEMVSLVLRYYDTHSLIG